MFHVHLEIRSIIIKDIYIFVHPHHGQAYSIDAMRISIVRKSKIIVNTLVGRYVIELLDRLIPEFLSIVFLMS